MPPLPSVGGTRAFTLLEAHIVPGSIVMSMMRVMFLFLMKVPCALKLTAPPVGTEPGTVVLVAAGRGVIVGVGPFGVLVGEGVIDAGGPSATLIESSTKPGGTGVDVTVLEL